MKQEKPQRVNFITTGNNVTFYFSGYPDETGKIRYVANGQDRNGKDIMKKFSFSEGTLSVHSSNVKEIQHLSESPYCLGSKLNKLKREKAYYIKVDKVGDAKKKLESQELLAKAVSKSLGVCNDKDLYPKVAVLCGATTGEESIQKSAIMTYAQANPEKFLEMTHKKNTPQLEYESFIKECIARGSLQERNGVIYFYDELLGKNTGEVIKRFTEKPEWLSALRTNHQELVSGPAPQPKKAIAGGDKTV